MFGVLDAAVHVHATLAASMTLDAGIGVDDFEFVGIFGDLQLVAWHHGDLREQRVRRFPAFGASAYVVVGGLRGDAHLYGITRAFAGKRATGEARRPLLGAWVDWRMNRDLCQGNVLPSLVLGAIAGPSTTGLVLVW